MQWRRQRRISHVIGSSNHALLIARYQDAPPGEEDEEDDIHNGYQTENRNGSARGERNMQGGYSSYKRTRPYNNTTNTYGYGYGSLYNGQSKSAQSKNDDDPTKPKIVFNEEEYMRITTPRQDVLFKKGYLSRKKPLASTASTSATSATTTPSTNDSQSAAHSTADGSETAEDQQLLDGSNGGNFAIVPEAAAQFAYGGFYDQVTGYYYEYPVMLVGPPVPGNPTPNVLAAMSCGPVPLRPVEWFNPQYMPESLQEQHPPSHSTDSQAGSCGSSVSMDEVGGAAAPASVELVSTCENRDEEVAQEVQDSEVLVVDETTTECVPPAQVIPQIVPHMHIPPQHYVYPGHFMFGPPMVNMNGVTIQNGAIVPSEALWAKRRKKKKRRKQRRPLAVGNTEDEEEEYSSEWESGSNWSQPAWSTSTVTAAPNDFVISKPLNPEVQEFQFRTALPVVSDAPDVKTPNLENAESPSLPHPAETGVDKCEVTKTENEDRRISVDNINLTNLDDGISGRQTLSEITVENGRVKDTENIRETVLNIIEKETNSSDCKGTSLTEKIGEVVKGDHKTASVASEEDVKNLQSSLSNETTILKNQKPFGENRPTAENGVQIKASNRVEHENNINNLSNIESEPVVSNSPTAESVAESLTSYTDSCKDTERNGISNNANLSIEENDKKSDISQQKTLNETTRTNGQNIKSVTLDSNQSKSSLLSNGKKVENELTNKKNGNKNVKKGKTKAMDARKPARNKRESRNPQRNDSASTAVSRELLQDRERSVSPDTRQALDLENSASQLPARKPSSRPTSPEINQTTTPINAETHRLPESYESLVTRSSPHSVTPSPPLTGAPVAPPRRKYSAKGLKFVREPTPGPDLDTDVKSDNEEGSKVDDNLRLQDDKVESISVDQVVPIAEVPSNTISQINIKDESEEVPAQGSSTKNDHTNENNNKNPVSRIDSHAKTQKAHDMHQKVDFPLDTDFEPKVILNRPGTSVEGNVIGTSSIGVDSLGDADADTQEVNAASKRSDHPITDAVAAWLERTKSPEIFRVPMPISDSDDSDLSETEIYDGDPNKQPSKNLQGNPMPALSVSNGSIDNCRRTRSNVVTSDTITKTDTFDTSKSIKRRREKDINNIEHISPTSEAKTSIEETSRSVRVCDFIIKGSAAGMRVAEKSRVDLNRLSTEKKRLKDNTKTSYIENIEMKIKNNTRFNDDITEDGIEVLENFKTYERGEIMVLDGKLLTGTVHEATCSEKSNLQDPTIIEEVRESNNNKRETAKNHARSIDLNKPININRNSEHEMSPEETLNSLGSIEEPDVLECWETEIMEPVVTLKNNSQMKLQINGKVHEGEATEDENYDNHSDYTNREHVKKYYRLAREYTLSIEDELSERALKQMNSNNISSNSNSPKRTTPNTPERMIECLCSEEIPIIVPLPKSTLTKANKVVKDGMQNETVDEAFEVYESCYTGKTRLAGVSQLNVEGSKIPLQNQEGPIPCKAVCCNIQ
ncbi:uncharacterized protein LOC124298381 isoform X1 [Neodiprion virginianus]|uniref:uncharacterized protein LOC124298381 isoform X1 n=1 Tax=Neodiprion virginianus TaxID=2961670 RepID=UPI001EE75BD9|nr:uncharacterized protein LOC124298381 isoform X1 [Neodiprion virginianus]